MISVKPRRTLSSAPTVTALRAALDRRDISAAEVEMACRQSAAAAEPAIGAFAELFPRPIFPSADTRGRHDRGGELWGIPFAAKANFDVAGQPTLCNSRAAPRVPAVRNATAVQRLVDAGAALLGITNMSEYAFGGAKPGLAPPVRNPIDPSRYAGGSSGGSAAAVATGSVPFAIGSDTVGSIRLPAAYCGVCGFRPTQRPADLEGLQPLAPTLDHLGVITRSAGDLALVARALHIGRETGSEAPRNLHDLRIGYAASAGAATEGDCSASRALERLAALGARVERIDIGTLAAYRECAWTIVSHEAARNLALVSGAARNDIGSLLRARLEAGARITPDAYARAQAQRQELAARLLAIAARCDVLASATAPTGAPRLADLDEPVALQETMLLPFSVAGMPALSLPCGRDADGLPLGLQLAAPRACDARLLSIATLVEAALAGRR